MDDVPRFGFARNRDTVVRISDVRVYAVPISSMQYGIDRDGRRNNGTRRARRCRGARAAGGRGATSGSGKYKIIAQGINDFFPKCQVSIRGDVVRCPGPAAVLQGRNAHLAGRSGAAPGMERRPQRWRNYCSASHIRRDRYRTALLPIRPRVHHMPAPRPFFGLVGIGTASVSSPSARPPKRKHLTIQNVTGSSFDAAMPRA